jgi:hypothetical protein
MEPGFPPEGPPDHPLTWIPCREAIDDHLGRSATCSVQGAGFERLEMCRLVDTVLVSETVYAPRRTTATTSCCSD